MYMSDLTKCGIIKSGVGGGAFMRGTTELTGPVEWCHFVLLLFSFLLVLLGCSAKDFKLLFWIDVGDRRITLSMKACQCYCVNISRAA